MDSNQYLHSRTKATIHDNPPDGFAKDLPSYQQTIKRITSRLAKLPTFPSTAHPDLLLHSRVTFQSHHSASWRIEHLNLRGRDEEIATFRRNLFLVDFPPLVFQKAKAHQHD